MESPRIKTVKNKNDTVAKDQHTNWKKAHNGIKDHVVET